MSDLMLGALSLPVLVALVFLRMPVGLAMLAVGAGGLALAGSPAMLLSKLKTETFSTFSSYSLSIIPMFLLMGHFAAMGGLSRALFRAAGAFLGHRKGGLGMAAIAACAGFGAICGSSMATAATMGQMALPELRRAGWSGGLSTATLAAGGTLGILIPPSVVLVLYAFLTEQNIARLFAAAVVPGVLAALSYALVIRLYLIRHPAEGGAPQPRASGAERRAALAAALPVLAIFLTVVGGIYLGVFTPTQGAAVGVAGTALAAALGGRLDRRTLAAALLATASGTGMVFLIILGAAVYNGFLALSGVPQALTGWIAGAGLAPLTVIALILLAYLVLGCVMDSLSMILLTVPILYPVVMALDLPVTGEARAVWFGVLALVAVEVGLITPPVGMNLFVLQSVAPDVPVQQTWRRVIWFVAADILRLALMMLVPGIVLFGVF